MIDHSIGEVALRISRNRSAWLERTLKQLLDSGITKDRIEVQEHPSDGDFKVVVAVDGKPIKQWTCKVTTSGNDNA